jgi:lambda family phage portal protein
MNISSYVGKKVDSVLLAIMPQQALRNKAARFAYDALQTDRTRRDHTAMHKTGDTELTEYDLDRLRDISRDMSQNNPLIKGILATEADDVVGTDTQVQARSDDEIWNSETEAAFKEQVIDRPYDITGRFSWHQILWKCFNSYRRDGDDFIINTQDGPQICEGNQCGTPIGVNTFDTFDIINGVAVSKKTGRIIGYYLGKPNKWGYIEPKAWQNYNATDVHHVFNSERFSFTRGEPIFTSAVTTIQKLFDYMDAELVAAKINACLATFVTITDSSRVTSPYTQGRFPGGEDAQGDKIERITPGLIKYLKLGEDIKSVIPTRPPSAFDPFVLRMFMIIGRPLCLPLMLVTLDFSGATFMNARIAYQAAQKNYKREQEFVVKPLARTIYNWWLADAIRNKVLSPVENAFRSEVICQRWPYVDPSKDASANQMELESDTTTEGTIIEARGGDYREFCRKKVREMQIRKDEGLSEPVEQPQK